MSLNNRKSYQEKYEDLKAKFEFEWAERVAIMVEDGKMDEIEAMELAREDVESAWARETDFLSKEGKYL